MYFLLLVLECICKKSRTTCGRSSQSYLSFPKYVHLYNDVCTVCADRVYMKTKG